MANAFTNFLGQVFDSPTQLKDYAHASRLYVDDFYRLAPKQGFMYYVIFNIESNGNQIVTEFKVKNGQDVGLLVKNIDLPKFKINTETVNQYNRKTQIQTKIDYQPVSIVFHDDHNNTTNSLWKAYFNYYFKDGQNVNGLTTPPSFGDTKYKKSNNSIGETTSYGLNAGQTKPFFSSIEIYQLNRKQFTAYKLINPLISDWQHDKMDQTQSKLLENRMSVVYETVIYATGQVKIGDPGGFAEIHYDTVPGPLSVFGSGNNSLFGPGGVIPGIGEVLGGAGDASPFGLLKTARGATNLLGNLKNVSKSSILSEGLGMLNDVARTGKLPAALGGSSPAGVALSSLPGESPTKAIPKNTQGGSNVSNAGLANNGLSQFGGTLGKVAGDISNGIKSIGNGIGNVIKKIIPAQNKPVVASALPTDSVSLTAIKSQQQSIAVEIENQIAENTIIKNQIMPKIQSATSEGDQDTVDELYSQLDAVGYTDPTKLQQNLVIVNQNISTIDIAIVDASATENPNNQLSAENVDLGTSPDNYYNVGGNPDLNTEPSRVYNNGKDTTTSYYV
jgi:hypothetical protein